MARSVRIWAGLTFLLISLSGAAAASAFGRSGEPSQERIPAGDSSRLAVLWTSGDREVALNVAFMYTHNAKLRGWFDEVTLIVWGPSARLLSEDPELQAQVTAMAEIGVAVVACQACADRYRVSENLRAIGVEVRYMGEPLTDMLKGGWEVLTF